VKAFTGRPPGGPRSSAEASAGAASGRSRTRTWDLFLIREAL
jgi:hypothetical protein